eukprot:c9039_g1_i1 orf=108-332(-)
MVLLGHDHHHSSLLHLPGLYKYSRSGKKRRKKISGTQRNSPHSYVGIPKQHFFHHYTGFLLNCNVIFTLQIPVH